MEQEKLFLGFPPEPNENYWRYPKNLNGYWHQLTGNEQKILDYILRHTWGYKKTADKISISQFKNGIQNKKTKEWIDRGTGIKHHETLKKGIERLEKLGFIETEKSKGKTRFIKLRLCQGMTGGMSKFDRVGMSKNDNTIVDITIKDKTIGSSFNKPYYKPTGEKMYKDEWDKWWVIKGRNDFSEFAGRLSDIGYK